MQDKKTLAVMAPATLQASESLKAFKQGVDALLAKRSYFISQVLPKLKKGQDFYVIMGRKSLSKGGAEKLTSIYNLTATFERDDNSVEMLKDIRGLVAFVCNLTRNGEIVGQGRGADTLVRNGGDPNKTIKMSQKRAYIDAVIRTTGLSDIFTQDLESMDTEREKYENNNVEVIEAGDEEDESNAWVNNIFSDRNNRPRRPVKNNLDESMITSRQRELLLSLLEQKVPDEKERVARSEEVDGLTKFDASEMIKELLKT